MHVTCASCDQIVEIPSELIGGLESVDQIEPYICDACESHWDNRSDDLDHEMDIEDRKVCPNCGNVGAIERSGIEQCDACGYPLSI